MNEVHKLEKLAAPCGTFWNPVPCFIAKPIVGAAQAAASGVYHGTGAVMDSDFVHTAIDNFENTSKTFYHAFADPFVNTVDEFSSNITDIVKTAIELPSVIVTGIESAVSNVFENNDGADPVAPVKKFIPTKLVSVQPKEVQTNWPLILGAGAIAILLIRKMAK